ncbi:SWIM zinc finger family protein [Sulfolobus sp. B1]
MVRIQYTQGNLRASCSCKGFAIRGNCKHVKLALRKISRY